MKREVDAGLRLGRCCARTDRAGDRGILHLRPPPLPHSQASRITPLVNGLRTTGVEQGLPAGSWAYSATPGEIRLFEPRFSPPHPSGAGPVDAGGGGYGSPMRRSEGFGAVRTEVKARLRRGTPTIT
jgi:hypothetical protein